MTDVTIQPATGADLVFISQLLRDCTLPFADLRAEQMPDFVVARSGEKIVASGGLEPCGEVALFRSLAVAPDFRGRRLGERIWAELRVRATDRGFRRLFLLTTTAEPLFARWGFRRVARETLPASVRDTKEFSALCPSTAGAMTIELV
jgi:amino-acid N-acetyltransferase